MVTRANCAMRRAISIFSSLSVLIPRASELAIGTELDPVVQPSAKQYVIRGQGHRSRQAITCVAFEKTDSIPFDLTVSKSFYSGYRSFLITGCRIKKGLP